ncbi:MAG: ParB/RepB/Spo0J family partition protein [Candidatus Firestonebacteria bacterium]|nr:ParB/RepB/Spo0J family partition protein [Candidatus Firestonebacteria bacterium]
MSRQALGKGLEALIPMDGNLDGLPAATSNRQELPIDVIAPNPFQPRREFQPHELEELAASIREKGVMQPIIVRPRPDGTYELVAGERRLRASKLAGMGQIPAIIRDVNDGDSLEMALIENVQREDLNPVEEARAYQQLMLQFQLTQEEMAVKVGKDRSSVANTLRLLKLPLPVLDMVGDGRISEGHARALMTLEDESAMQTLAEKVLRESLSVRETERLAQGNKPAKPAKPRSAKGEIKDPHARHLEEELRRKLGTHVKVSPRNGQKGKIEIEYYSLEDLDRIVSLMG